MPSSFRLARLPLRHPPGVALDLVQQQHRERQAQVELDQQQVVRQQEQLVAAGVQVQVQVARVAHQRVQPSPFQSQRQ
jgi:cell division protein FtsL